MPDFIFRLFTVPGYSSLMLLILLVACGSNTGPGTYGTLDTGRASDLETADAAGVLDGVFDTAGKDVTLEDAGDTTLTDVVDDLAANPDVPDEIAEENVGTDLLVSDAAADVLDTVSSCLDDPACAPLWETSCQGTTGYKVCGIDGETGCPEVGLFVSCAYGNTCSDGLCQGACVVPEVMLVVDRSSSMEGPVWDFTKEALTAFAEQYQAGMKLGLRTFPGDAGCDTGATLAMALDNAAAIPGSLVEPAVSSSTPIGAALANLGVHFGDPGQGEYVVLLSDGSETCGDPEDALLEAELLRSRGTTVHTVGLGYGYDAELLADIAAAGGGTFQTAQNGAELATALQSLSGELTGCEQPPLGLAYCDAAECVVECPEGSHACDGACAADDDADACGAACEVCPDDANGTPVCLDGACSQVCDADRHLCDGACAADDDAAACGADCEVCPSDPHGEPTCVAGSCSLSCAPDWHLCGSQCVADSDPAQCGPDCLACPGDPHGDPSCVAGTCGLVCDPGWLDCQNACTACPSDPNGFGTCDGAACVLACDPGYHLCDGNCAPDADPNACGADCVVCPGNQYGSPVCLDGQCGIECEGGALFCGGGCVPCPTDPNGHGSCSGAACVLNCDPGWHACGDACKADDDATACGNTCNLCPTPANASPTCVNGDCAFECNQEALLCAGSCAACPAEVNGTAICSGASCILDCEPGFHSCSGLCAADSDVTACGLDCEVCPQPQNATPTCLDGSCGFECNPGSLLCGGACPACPDPGGIEGDFICWQGNCLAPCAPGTHFCDGSCVSDDSPAHCGDSCTPCPAPGESIAICEEGECAIFCPEGTAPCDDGCCTWLIESVDFTNEGLYGASRMRFFDLPDGTLGLSYHNSNEGFFLTREANGWTSEQVLDATSSNLHSLRILASGWGVALTNQGWEWDLTTRPPAGSWGTSSMQSASAQGGSITVDSEDTAHLFYSRFDWPPNIYYRTWKNGSPGPETILRTLGSKQYIPHIEAEISADDTLWVAFSEVHQVLEGNAWVSYVAVVVAHKAAGDSEWTIEEVTGYLKDMGRCSLALASDGTPHVAWTRAAKAYHAVRSGDGTWTTTQAWSDIATLADVALALDGNGEPHLAYQVQQNPAWFIVHVHRSGQDWVRSIIEHPGDAYVGHQGDIDVLSDGRVIVAYRYAGAIGNQNGRFVRVATSATAP